jgi:hypothetical protein
MRSWELQIAPRDAQGRGLQKQQHLLSFFPSSALERRENFKAEGSYAPKSARICEDV